MEHDQKNGYADICKGAILILLYILDEIAGCFRQIFRLYLDIGFKMPVFSFIL